MTQIKSNDANIIEIFSSIQGEGPYIGYKQLFVRFSECNLNCNYCDTNVFADKSCSVFYKRHCEGRSNLKSNNQAPWITTLPLVARDDNTEYKVLNPISVQDLAKLTLDFSKNHFHSISLTGGEPLLSADFINSYIIEAKKLISSKFYLETNGTLPQILENIINNIDIISMDIKIESSTGQKADYEANSKFMEVAKRYKKEIFAKIVMTSKVNESEIIQVSELCSFHKIPLIVQPVSTSDLNLILSSEQMSNIIDLIMHKHSDVRLIPQVHKFLNLQ
ncbi:MAG: 7-carboxy-7-deazaguanine synthase QueE [Candidatus Gastranaerophilaceae bacterium]|jgi:organic radical activating enzyme